MSSMVLSFFTGCTAPVTTGSPSTAPPGYNWNELSCWTHLLHSDPADHMKKDQFFLQSTPILDDHDRIIPVSDHQVRVES